jgi:DnaJ-class molecular chaperone
VSVTCPVCKGSGQTPYTPPAGMISGSQTQNCTRCAGAGKVDSLKADETPVPDSEKRALQRGGPLNARG